MRKNVFALLLACGLVAPGGAFADQCDDVFAQAAEKFNSATEAGKKEDFEGAMKLYGQAEKLFQQVSAMQDCRQGQITITAARNVGLCRSNASKIKKGLDKAKADKKEADEVDAYNQATGDYNRGVEAFNNSDWDAASDALESAAAIWESIASDKSKNGRLAVQYAQRARKMADMARQYKFK